MKLHFEPNLDFQLQAIEAVCGLFRGQETCRTEFTVTKSAVGGAMLPGLESDLGIGNRLTLLDDEIHQNLSDIQLRNGLAPSSSRTAATWRPWATWTGTPFRHGTGGSAKTGSRPNSCWNTASPGPWWSGSGSNHP